MMAIVTQEPLIEAILEPWRDRIGADYAGYHGHVYRMFNFCLALKPCGDEERAKLATAASFHDIGLWSDHTVDYLPPSIVQARTYLAANGGEAWEEEISLMIDMHHKVRPYADPRFPLVELFRKGDLVDFSLGVVTFGLPRAFIRSVQRTIPNAGFHRFLLKGAGDWFKSHPFSPPPFMKW
jgi:hypothetical protein